MTVNGASPVVDGSSDGHIELEFTRADGLPGRRDYACLSGGWAYSVELWVGTYRIEGSPDSGSVRVPWTDQVLVSRIDLR